MVEGDRNTNFFHNSVLIRRRKNRITCMKDSIGNWITGDRQVANFIRQGFIQIVPLGKSGNLHSGDVS